MFVDEAHGHDPEFLKILELKLVSKRFQEIINEQGFFRRVNLSFLDRRRLELIKVKHRGSEGVCYKVKMQGWSGSKNFGKFKFDSKRRIKATSENRPEENNDVLALKRHKTQDNRVPYFMLRELSFFELVKHIKSGDYQFPTKRYRGIENIVTMHASFFEPSYNYHDCKLYALYDYHEYNLSNLMKSRVIIPELVTINLIRQLLNGLSFIHALGVAHRNIKPLHLLLNIRNLNQTDEELITSSSNLS